MFTIISLNSCSKCDSWNPQHIFKWHVSSQKVHTNTVSYIFSHSGTDISFCTSSFLPCAETCACFPEMVQHNLWMSSYLWMYSSDCRWNTFFLCVSFVMIPVSALSLPSQGVIKKVFICLQFLQIPQGAAMMWMLLLALGEAKVCHLSLFSHNFRDLGFDLDKCNSEQWIKIFKDRFVFQ